MSKLRPPLRTIFVTLVALAVAISGASTAHAADGPDPTDPRPVIWGVTDSVFFDVAPWLDVRLPDHRPIVRGFPGLHLRTVVGLQLDGSTPNAPGPGVFDGPGVMVNDAPLRDDIVVIALGYMFWGDDAAQPARYEAWIDELLTHTDDARRVLWIRPRRWDRPGSSACGGATGQACNDYMTTVNAMLDDAAANHPNVELLNWGAEVQGHPEWIAPDGIHLNGKDDGSSGVGAMADFVVDAINESPFPPEPEPEPEPEPKPEPEPDPEPEPEPEPGPTNRKPVVKISKFDVGKNRILLKGYLFDPDHSRTVAGVVTLDGVKVKRFQAKFRFKNLTARTNALSNNHGFRARVKTPEPGEHEICLLLGRSKVKQSCRTFTVE